MSNPITDDETNLLNTTDYIHPSSGDISLPPANSAISSPLPPPIDSPQVPFENASSSGQLISDPSPSIPPKSTPRVRKRNRKPNSVPGRKPGRPRKYGPDDVLSTPRRVVNKVIESQSNPLAVTTLPSLSSLPTQPNYVSAPLPPLARPSSPSLSAMKPKRKPGRPFGTGKKKTTDAASTSIAPIPTITSPTHHRIGIPACDVDMKAIFVNPGEDVVEKLTNYTQQNTKSMFISSAYGSVSSATIRPPTALTGSTTYEGLFQITSLSGSLIQVEMEGQRTWIGGLSVSLTGQDNQSHVGGVAGSMIAATPIQIIVCSFNLENEDKSKPAMANHVNDTKIASLAVNGALNEPDSGGVASTSIPVNGGA